ncbi:cell division protein FtsQ/DivIB [Carnobacterium funditum]|uniref:cell division protein FtsQ/DivIB n=1 Tax=Carnobacterium funditum TaxID=2752 RepID=UPI000690FE1A|nr:cell division protein FtsQ/DivIB [Carnobacterium funditum]
MTEKQDSTKQKKKLSAQSSSWKNKIRGKKAEQKKRNHSLEDKLPKLKEKRRKKMQQRLILLLLLFSFAILVVVYFITPLSKIGKISVSGASEVTDQAVIDASQIKSGDSLWETFFLRKEKETLVKKQLSQVKSMDLKFDSVNSYELVITEYKTVAYLENNDAYYNILENGKIVNESRKVSIGNQPIFIHFKEGKVLNEMLDQYHLLKENIHNSVSEVEYTPSKTDPYLIKMYMNDGNQVIASITSFARKMAYYPDIVRKIGKEKGTINIEVGIYFLPFESVPPEIKKENDD